jgi:hypothetical protein
MLPRRLIIIIIIFLQVDSQFRDLDLSFGLRVFRLMWKCLAVSAI